MKGKCVNKKDNTQKGCWVKTEL